MPFNVNTLHLPLPLSVSFPNGLTQHLSPLDQRITFLAFAILTFLIVCAMIAVNKIVSASKKGATPEKSDPSSPSLSLIPKLAEPVLAEAAAEPPAAEKIAAPASEPAVSMVKETPKEVEEIKLKASSKNLLKASSKILTVPASILEPSEPIHMVRTPEETFKFEALQEVPSAMKTDVEGSRLPEAKNEKSLDSSEEKIPLSTPKASNKIKEMAAQLHGKGLFRTFTQIESHPPDIYLQSATPGLGPSAAKSTDAVRLSSSDGMKLSSSNPLKLSTSEPLKTPQKLLESLTKSRAKAPPKRTPTKKLD